MSVSSNKVGVTCFDEMEFKNLPKDKVGIPLGIGDYVMYTRIRKGIPILTIGVINSFTPKSAKLDSIMTEKIQQGCRMAQLHTLIKITPEMYKYLKQRIERLNTVTNGRDAYL